MVRNQGRYQKLTRRRAFRVERGKKKGFLSFREQLNWNGR